MKIIKDGQGISELTRLADSGGSGIGSTSNALDVYIQGGSSVTEYAEGATAATPTGTVILVEGPSNVFYPLLIDANKHLQVDIAADSVGVGGGILYASGDAPTIPTGTMIMFQGAGNVAQSISATRPLPVTGTFSVNGSTLTITGNDTDFATETTLSTLATQATLVTLSNTLSTISGHIDGIEGLLGGTLTVDNGGTFAVQASQSGTWNIGTLTSITNPVSVAGSTIAVTGGTYATESTLTTLYNTIATISGHVDNIETTLVNIQYAVESGFDVLTTGNIVTSGLGSTDGNIINAPGASTHLRIHHLKAMNHGGEIRFMVRDGAGGTILGAYTLAASGGGFSEQFRRPIKLSSNTALYYDYVSNAYNPDVSVGAIYESLPD